MKHIIVAAMVAIGIAGATVTASAQVTGAAMGEELRRQCDNSMHGKEGRIDCQCVAEKTPEVEQALILERQTDPNAVAAYKGRMEKMPALCAQRKLTTEQCNAQIATAEERLNPANIKLVDKSIVYFRMTERNICKGSFEAVRTRVLENCMRQTSPQLGVSGSSKSKEDYCACKSTSEARVHVDPNDTLGLEGIFARSAPGVRILNACK